MQHKYLQIHAKDNVLVALQNLSKSETIEFNNKAIILQEDIPAKHKFFIDDMNVDSIVYMYGVVVGLITKSVIKGERLSIENCKHDATPYAFKNYNYHWAPITPNPFEHRTFNGYHRADGAVGTANYWLFIPTVFCENRNLDIIKETLNNELGYSVSNPYKEFTKQLIAEYTKGEALSNSVDLTVAGKTKLRFFKNIDGIKFLNHQGGCGGTRQDSETLSKLLAGYAVHPNVAGVTILSLGCQHLQVTGLLKDIKDKQPHFNKPLLIFEQQESKSETQLICDAIKQTFLGLIEANKHERKPAPLSKLTIGVKCGGSDGFSGISANPAVGYCADLLVSLGGKVLLAEFPELCGVEQELINRIKNPDASKKFIQLMDSYQKAAIQAGSGFHCNPSPGNIKDGLITDAIKSAGAAKKGGNSPIEDVLDYTEIATKPGLNLVCTPGNDVEATTGKVASGATLILFTTGLGTPTGNPICPIIKVSSNSALALKMSDIIDINTGSVIEGKKTITEMGEDILEFCIQVASGTIIPKTVQLLQDDFIPWKRGVSL